MTQTIGIIGGGIVGSTAAYYLAKENHSVTLFDDGIGQATSAAAGIISPWLSQRRSKEWYFLAKEGAKFYQQLISDLNIHPQDSPIYQQTGTILYKKNQKLLEKLYHLAHERRDEAPEIGDIKYLSPEDVSNVMPLLSSEEPALFISGGAKVDGQKLIHALHDQTFSTDSTLIPSKVASIRYESNKWSVYSEEKKYSFDQLILACGAWLPTLIEPLAYTVDIRPQKGQLLEFNIENLTDDAPVVMPVGEIDIIPFKGGKLLVGATHENDMGYDLTPDLNLLQQLKDQAIDMVPSLSDIVPTNYRVGTRAYTSDFLPFFGQVDSLPQLFVASGLGSSGLTTGPIIGKTLADWVLKKETLFENYYSLPNRYIQPK